LNVRELIEKLQKFDPETPVRIWDADTGWALNVEIVDTKDGVVRVAGTYMSRDMDLDSKWMTPW
jgi:hypothetical protein